MKEFAQCFKYERKRLALSQAEVASKLGTTAPTVSRWERGVTLPTPYYRQQLCTLFGKSIEEMGLLEEPADLCLPSPELVGVSQAHATVHLSVSPPPVQLPNPRNPLFTGREEVLLRLGHLLHTDQNVARAICGLGGIGKTQVATEYAYRSHEAYQGIFWVRAETREVLLSDLGTLAVKLTLTRPGEPPPQSAIEAIKGWLNEHTQWLLIVDNIEELSLLHEVLPSHCQGHVILTTRCQFTGPRIQRIDLDKMEPEEGATFLLRRAKRLGSTDPLGCASEADRRRAAEISRLMDGLPLALDQAGAYIEEASCSVSHYVDLLHSRRAELLGLRNLSGTRDTDHPHSVQATFTLTFERIRQTHPAAIEVLYLCAFLHPDAIPEEVLAEGAPDLNPPLREVASDPLLLDETIAKLLKYSLLHRHPERHTLSMHRLVQAVIKDSMDETQQRQWAQMAVQVVNRVFPDVELWVTSSQCQRYFSQAQVCAALIEAWDIACVEAGRLLTQLAYYLYELSQHEMTLFVQAEPLLKKALVMLTPLVGAEHRSIANAQRALGWVYATLEDYTQAEVCYQQALAILESQPRPDHRIIAGCFIDMGMLYEYQGHYAQAEPCYQRATDISEPLLGPDDMDVAAALHNFGRCCLTQGKYTQAEPLLLRASDISQKLLGLEHPITASGLYTLAKLYLAQELYAQAEPLLLRSLEVRQKVLKPGHPSLALTLSALGRLYLAQARYAQAESLLRQAFEIRQQVLGPDHPLTTQVRQDLTNLSAAQSRHTNI